MNDFEQLLIIKQEMANKTISNNKQSRQTSEKNATLYDFIKMLQKVITLTMKDLEVELIPDEGKIPITDSSIHIDHPYISYNVIERKPKNELKPRFREEITEISENDKPRVGDMYGQKFECIVEFNIFASVYDTAEKVMEKFEEVMFTYSGFFKKNGLGEILFLEQSTNKFLNSFRETTSIRSLQYYLEVEKLYLMFKDTIENISVFDN